MNKSQRKGTINHLVILSLRPRFLQPLEQMSSWWDGSGNTGWGILTQRLLPEWALYSRKIEGNILSWRLLSLRWGVVSGSSTKVLSREGCQKRGQVGAGSPLHPQWVWPWAPSPLASRAPSLDLHLHVPPGWDPGSASAMKKAWLALLKLWAGTFQK